MSSKFTYACFISYRHGQQKETEEVIDCLYKALSYELEYYLDQKVYLDRHHLKGGKLFNENLADALRQSVCMVIVYSPRYFSIDHTYCSREYKAMEKIEKERLQAPGLSRDDRDEGLIIPIVFRNKDSLPNEIKERRQYYDFEDYTLAEPELSRHPKYAAKIKEIAKYIYDRHEALSKAEAFYGCEDEAFELPSDDEIKEWLMRLGKGGVKFVNR